MAKQDKGQMVKVFNFNSNYAIPEYKINRKGSFIEWGTKNQYPTYLLDLYNHIGSSTHKMTINKKHKYITGNGFEPINSPELKDFILNNDLGFEMTKVGLDYELFNGFAWELIYANDGSIASFKHIPFHKLRLGVQTEDVKVPYVWFCNDWTKFNKEGYKPEGIRIYNPMIKTGKQIVYYNEYNPQTDGLYPIAPYANGSTLNYIELDYEISKFHLNQAKSGYAPQFLLNFATGIPTAEEQDEFFSQFQREYKGTQGGNIIITYSEGSDQKPELLPIQLNDSDKRFTQLMDLIDNKIVLGSEIPYQLVLSVPGKLGSTDERKELQSEFQQSYVTPRQNILETVINKVLSNNGYPAEIKLKQYNNTITQTPTA
jgi:hypothetical protein